MPFDAASYIMGKNASGGGGSAITVEPLTVTENDTYTAPDGKAYTPVTVNVPNSYSASDEGKVVDNGELVAQTAHAEVTSNGTIDTTLNNSVVVNVSGGGGTEVPSNDVNFIDYDGTIVASYSAADFANLSALPANPSHSGLTAQGWNWTLSDAKTYVASYGFLDIGQMYITDDGKTRIYVHFEEGRTSPYLGLCPNGTVDIDWGDGSTHDTLTGTNLTTVKNVQHIFQPGDYVITLTPASGTTFALPGSASTSSGLLSDSTGSTNAGKIYRLGINKIEIGIGVQINNYAFDGAWNLSSVTMAKELTGVAPYSFQKCYSLRFLTIPNTFEACALGMFNSCTGLRLVSIPKSAKLTSTSIFYACNSLQRLAIPEYTGALGKTCAQSALIMSSLKIPSGIDTISQTAFASFSCTDVTIPASCTSIQATAFNLCYALAKIKFLGSTPPTLSASSAFGSLPTDCIIYVPYAGLASYLTATNYPASATYTYLGFATYASGATLPTQDTTQAYNVTWYATKEDAIAGTNPITQGNGSEVYCTYAAV